MGSRAAASYGLGMAVNGPNLLDSDNASTEYTAVLFLVVERLGKSMARLATKKDVDVAGLGDLEVLRVLADAHPVEAGMALKRKELAAHRQTFSAWLQTKKARFRKVGFEDYQRSVDEAFERLMKHAT